MGKVAVMLVTLGTPEHRNSIIPEYGTPKILNLLKIRGEKLPGVVKFSCKIIP
jgi:hypothetical protein